ncbi:hypothetical protein B0I08_101159 [Glaciihabitans tibetensis]|uniref:Uncharacterized protein n=1 Tax=Glaciihabitans tibetensis TaxID=1266600 RepID=A0A2T0VIL9_9MICO|nr:hypothetical protein [Glaciihabitans tibetensis]PRY70037.1 hypothetical protein B0I08_101159 [Glaciihabitans tibetensis]
MTDSAVFGIAAQVFVRDASLIDPSPWPASPSGVILRSGGSALQGVWGSAGGGQLWWVEFDEPQHNSSGDGPFATAQVHEKFLELAPAFEGDPGADAQ